MDVIDPRRPSATEMNAEFMSPSSTYCPPTSTVAAMASVG